METPRTEKPLLPSSVRTRILHAQSTLWAARALPALGPALALWALWIALAAADVWRGLPGWLHGTAFALLVLQTAAWLAWRRAALAWPTRAAAMRALERQAGLDHAPLQALRDQPFQKQSLGGRDPLTHALWRLEQARLAKRMAALGWLRPRWPSRRFGWGAAAMGLALGLGLGLSGPDAGRRLAQWMMPDVTLPPGPEVGFDLWIEPPQYTRQPAYALTAQEGMAGPLRLPQGSQITLVIRPGPHAPKALWNGQTWDPGADQRWVRRLESDGDLLIYGGARQLGRLEFRTVADLAPLVDFAAAPVHEGDGRLKIPLAAYDDHGLAALGLRIRRVDRGDSFALPLTPPAGEVGVANGPVEWDAGAHIWSGLRVDAQIFVRDGADQETASRWITVKLPERDWENPTAQILNALRHDLLRNPFLAEETAQRLARVMAQPQAYDDDVTVTLALAAAQARLRYGAWQEADAAAALIFDAALRLEDGGARRQMERALENAWRALQNALNQPDTAPEDLGALMQALRDAMGEWLEELMDEALRNNEALQNMTPQDQQALGAMDLMDWLDEALRRAQEGDAQALRDMLSQLENLMGNLRDAQIMPPDAGDAARQQTLDQLGPLMRDQQGLMDETGRRAEGMPGSSEQSLAERQEGLRERLDEMMRQLQEGPAGEAPESFGRAGEAMDRAARALREGDAEGSAQAQAEALDALRDGAQSLAQGMGQGQPQFGVGSPQPGQQQGQPQPGQGMGQRDPRGRDPLGRSLGQRTDEDAVRGTGPVQQSRDLIEELRRRAADPNRSPEERRYIERLLRRF